MDSGEGRGGLGKGPMKKGIGVVVHGVGIAGGLGGTDEDTRAPVMVRGGSQPVGPDAVLVPRFPRLRRDMGHAELAYRV